MKIIFFAALLLFLPFWAMAQEKIITETAPVAQEAVYDLSSLTQKPEYPGGINAFYNTINQRFIIPEIDKNGTYKVYAVFVIEKDGLLSSIRITKDPGYGLGEQLVQVLKSMDTRWSPGILNGQVVRASYRLPLTINISG